MTTKEQRAALTKPQMARLKEVGRGVKMGLVLGDRVLVQPIKPFTKADEVEKKGLLFIPETTKEANTPLPSTGIVMQNGEGTSSEWRLDVPVGTAVMFSKYGGTVFIIEQLEYRMFDTKDIMCTLEVEDGTIAEIAS